MDEIKNNKTYVEYKAQKELEEEKAVAPVEEVELSKGERFFKSLAHFWFYNKWKLLIGIIVIVAIVSFVYFFIQNNTKKCFSVVLVNSQVWDGFDEDIADFDRTVKDKGLYGPEFKTEVRDSYRHFLKSEEELEIDDNVTGSMQRLSHEFMEDLVDVLIVNTRCADEYNGSDGLLPLDQLLTKEELESIPEEYLYYNNDKLIGIRIEASQILQEHLIYREGDEYLIVVSSFSSRKEINHEFVMYLIEH